MHRYRYYREYYLVLKTKIDASNPLRPCILAGIKPGIDVIEKSVRNVAYRNTCINNLKQIQNAKEQWARENHKSPTDIPTEEDLYGVDGTNGFLRHKLICPLGGNYTIGAVNENPTCSLTNKGHVLGM